MHMYVSDCSTRGLTDVPFDLSDIGVGACRGDGVEPPEDEAELRKGMDRVNNVI